MTGGCKLFMDLLYLVMLLMRANPVDVGKRLGPGNRDFFGP